MSNAAMPGPWCLPGERWLPVTLFEGRFVGEYEGSDFGRCRSLDRERETANGQIRNYKGRVLRPYSNNGYPTVRFSRDTAPVGMHVLVLTLFDSPRPDGMEALHGDGDRANCRLDNLRWGSISANRQDAVGHRTHVGTSRDRCDHGHLFAGPNLLCRSDGTGRARRCKACTLSKSATTYYRRRGLAFDAKVYADRKYAELMAGTEWEGDAPSLADLPVIAAAVEPVDVRPTDIPGEDWRPIPGWDDSHEVSDHARVRSISRWVDYSDGRRHWYTGKVFKLTESRGYLITGLPVRGADGRMRSKTFGVHKLVMRAFKGPTPDGLEILHNDGNGLNARLDNLRFGSHFENAQDMIRHGRTARERRGDTCDYGHQLVAPNLRESKLPARLCLACSRGWWVMRQSGYQGVSFQEVADRKYREIMGTETAEEIAARTRTQCGRGHDLAPFNLVESHLPALNCKACSRARSSVRFAASKGVTLDIQKVADEKYAALMSSAA